MIAFIAGHALLALALAVPAVLGKAHRAAREEREREARRVRCRGCGVVIGELAECAPYAHAPDLRETT